MTVDGIILGTKIYSGRSHFRRLLAYLGIRYNVILTKPVVSRLTKEHRATAKHRQDSNSCQQHTLFSRSRKSKNYEGFHLV